MNRKEYDNYSKLKQSDRIEYLLRKQEIEQESDYNLISPNTLLLSLFLLMGSMGLMLLLKIGGYNYLSMLNLLFPLAYLLRAVIIFSILLDIFMIILTSIRVYRNKKWLANDLFKPVFKKEGRFVGWKAKR